MNYSPWWECHSFYHISQWTSASTPHHPHTAPALGETSTEVHQVSPWERRGLCADGGKSGFLPSLASLWGALETQESPQSCSTRTGAPHIKQRGRYQGREVWVVLKERGGIQTQGWVWILPWPWTSYLTSLDWLHGGVTHAVTEGVTLGSLLWCHSLKILNVFSFSDWYIDFRYTWKYLYILENHSKSR